MNSEVFKELTDREQEKRSLEADKRQLQESLVTAEANAVELMMNSAGWKLVARDLDLIQAGLMNKLRHTQNLSKSTMERYIDNMNCIEIFKTCPTKYLERMKMLIKRKIKEK